MIATGLIIAWTVMKKPVFEPDRYLIPRRIEYAFTIENRTGYPARDVEFWTFAPLEQTSVYKCDQIQASHPFEITKDSLGNRILRFSFQEMPPRGAKVIRIGADLLLSGNPVPETGTDTDKFLGAERYCESDHPDISDLARQLSGPDPVRTAEQVFDWVSSRINHTGYVKNIRGALYTLKQGQGDCTEVMYLFTALCRAAGTPARGTGGFVVKESSVLKPSGYHNWAEFFDGRYWQTADPQAKAFMDTSAHYIAFHRIGAVENRDQILGKQFFKVMGEGLHAQMKP